MCAVFNTYGIDTIGFKTTSSALDKLLGELKLKCSDYSNNYIINEYFKKEKIKLKNDTKVWFVQIGTTNNLSSYIIIKYNVETMTASRIMKQSKSHYAEVIFAGLRQPTKKIAMRTYGVLSAFIKRFKVAYVDVCFDGRCPISIDNKMYYSHPFEEYVGSRTNVTMNHTTLYINAPVAPDVDADYFVKICLYDKYIKESRYKELSDTWKDWKRMEFRVKLGMKLKESEALADYLYSMLPIAKKYYEALAFDSSYFNKQVKWLTDKRTQGHHIP